MDIKNKDKNLTKDELLVDYIKDQLEEKMQASAMDINVTARDGAIQLSGFTDVLSEKNFAGEITKNIKGVRKVENSITIAMDSKITDKHIEKEVIERLASDHKADMVAGVGVKIQDGVANLMGTVDNLKEAHVAMDIASMVRGVKDVVNNVKISTLGAVDDVTINNTIHQELRDSNVLDERDIATEVKNGKVTLQGYVNSSSEVEFAKEISMGIEGVRKVRNNLRIRGRDK